MGGNGCLDMMDERPGDAVVLYELEEGEPCPVCNASLPPFPILPHMRQCVGGERNEY